MPEKVRSCFLSRDPDFKLSTGKSRASETSVKLSKRASKRPFTWWFFKRRCLRGGGLRWQLPEEALQEAAGLAAGAWWGRHNWTLQCPLLARLHLAWAGEGETLAWPILVATEPAAQGSDCTEDDAQVFGAFEIHFSYLRYFPDSINSKILAF